MNTLIKFLKKNPTLLGVVTVAVYALIAGPASLPLQAGESADAVNADSEASFRNYVEFLRAELKSGKVVIYSRVMKLSDAEEKNFWPIYQDYETELFALGDRRLELIKKFTTAYKSQTLDNATAKDLTKEWFARQEERLKLWKKYQKRIEKKLNATRAAQFLQIESRISALIDLMIASELPLIDPAAGVKSPAAKP